MKRIYIVLTLLFLSITSFAQTTEDLAIELTAKVQEVPAKITLHWKLLTVDTPTYYVYRKMKTATSWALRSLHCRQRLIVL